MQSVIYKRFGEPVDVLEVGDSPIPQPAAGQVRIRMILAAIHNHDLITARGVYGYRPTLPAIGGTEAMGVVDALGEGVDSLTLGQRVSAAGVAGAWAEYFIAPAHAVVAVPAAISNETAAQLIAMPLSALMLLDFIDVNPGQWIIQNAANGAAAKALAMFAQGRGIHVINLVRRDAALAELGSLGIEHVVSTEQPGWEDRVRTIAGSVPISAAVDSVGGKAAGELASLLGEGGLLVSFGVMGAEALQILSSDLIFRRVTVKGFWGSKTRTTTSPEDMRRLMGELLTRASSGQLKLEVEEIFHFTDVAQAAAANSRHGRKGKVLLKP
jgi:NADPH:quinone reductase-like Zn-dependent oxidoreductase